MPSPRFRRSSTLAIYWLGEDLVCENYRTKSKTCINSRGITVLGYLGEWRTRRECSEEFTQYSQSSVFRVLDQLVDADLVLKEGSPQDDADAACAQTWNSWLPEAGLLHFGTKNTPFAEDAEEIGVLIDGLLKASPQPASFKVHPGTPSIDLPKPLRNSFVDVLLKRRTHRRFAAEPLSLNHLSALLHYTWGVTGFIHDSLVGTLPLKTSPSGGARHPEEVYVVALNVDGLKPGFYHYVADRHYLEALPGSLGSAGAINYCAGQRWVGGASALFILTAVFARTMWKYPVPRVYRAVLAEAGHLCQTFCLVASSLGLAPFCTMALKDSVIESDLGINGFDESVLYLAGVGTPAAS
jgi:SagB-type dehydrogenase family enzyme